jgi:hypothetical protein
MNSGDDWGLGAPPTAPNQCLPSGDAALNFVRAPSVGGFVNVLGTVAVRGTLVAGGLYLAGVRGMNLLKYTGASVGAIEVGVLGWALVKANG